jgi:tRNA(Ile)-lysidine synthase
MIDKISQTISKYNLINKNDKIVIGVSGGPDSISLLWALFNLGYNIVVCHVNHGLRKKADDDEKYVKDFCKKYKIPVHVKHINLKDKSKLKGLSTEEAGRKARYDFFNEILKKENASLICTAHNANDNVETIILNIMRGSGVSGLKGILPKSGNIIRPLIECSRDEVNQYCKENKLNPRHDESNDKTIYTRNKVRLELIPYLEKNINANVISCISRMSLIAREEEDFVNQEVEQNYANLLCDNDDNCLSLNLKKFNSLHLFLRKRIVLKAIFNLLGNTKDIEKVHVDDIVKMCENNVGGKYLTPKKYLKISIKNRKVYFEIIKG